jgi:hypothetical protein
MSDQGDTTNPATRNRWEFNPEQLDRTVLAIPLIRTLDEEDEAGVGKPHALVIELNLEHPQPREQTRNRAIKIIDDAIKAEQGDHAEQFINHAKSDRSQQYLFARLRGSVIRRIVKQNEKAKRPIFRIWPDFEIGPL